MRAKTERIKKLEEFANFVIERLKTQETIDERALLKIEAEFEKLKIFILSSFTHVEIDMNPEIMQEISLIEAKLNTALELARSNIKPELSRKKFLFLKEIVAVVSKLIEKLRLG